jgi:Ser/Thr protein kinase RdoA (MazF antagonist)
MVSRRALITAARRMAEAAIADYPIPRGRLTFLTLGENATFRHDGPAGTHLVRVHRPQRHGASVDSEAAIASELCWLRALRADTPLLVPEVEATVDGRVVVRITQGDQTRLCSVLRWMTGRIHEDSASAVHFRRLGVSMALLHQHGDGWRRPREFTRIAWDHDAFFGDKMIYGDLPVADCWARLPRALRARFHAVGDRMRGIMDSCTDHGLIHADLHMGNVLFEAGRAKPIDFDDCGTGPRLYDLAVAVWEVRDRPRYRRCLDGLLDGYRRVRPIELANLDDYIAMRQVAFDLWFTGTAHVDPAFAARVDNVHRWSLDMLDLVEGR